VDFIDGSIRNLNGARILMWHFTDHQVCFLTVVCTLWGTLGGILWYLLWIWRKIYRGKLIGLVVFNTLSMKLRVTYVYVLLLVPMIPSFQSRSLKTMVLIIEHWSIRSACKSYLEGLILDLVSWIVLTSTQWLQFARIEYDFLCWEDGLNKNHRIWHAPHKCSCHSCPCLSVW
jgi:hypothetical protein